MVACGSYYHGGTRYFGYFSIPSASGLAELSCDL
jgi:hypothetical protein